MLAVLLFLLNSILAVTIYFYGNGHIFSSQLLFIAFIFSSLFYSALIWSKEFRPVGFSLMLYFSYGLILPGFYQVRTNNFYWPTLAKSSEMVDQSALIVLTGLLFLILGYVVNPRKPFQAPPANASSNGVHFIMRRYSRAAFIVSLLVFLYVVYVLAEFGPGLFFGTRSSISATGAALGLNTSTFGLTRSFSQGTSLSVLTICGYLIFRVGKVKLDMWVAFCLALAAAGIANFPLSVPRYWLVATLFVLALTVFNRYFVMYRAIIYFSAPILVFLIFPTLGSYNRHGSNVNFSFSYVEPQVYLAQGDLDGFQSIVNAVNLVNVDGISWGGRLLSAAFFFVPRAIWSGKYESTGSDAAAQAGYQFLTISMPFPGELYANGGLILVVVGMFLLGAVIRRLDKSFSHFHRITTYPELGMVAILLAAFMPILFRGSLLGVIAGFATGVFMIVLWSGLWRIRVK